MNNEIKIPNYLQAKLYMKHGVFPIRCEYGYDDKIIFVFDKEESKEVYIKWRKRELF